MRSTIHARSTTVCFRTFGMGLTAAFAWSSPASAAPIIYQVSGAASAYGVSDNGLVVATNVAAGASAPGGIMAVGGVAVSGDGSTFVSSPSLGLTYEHIAVRRYGPAFGQATMYVPDRGDANEAFAASYDGTVAVGRGVRAAAFNPVPPAGTYAVRYTGDAGADATILGDLPGGVINAGAFGVSGDGTITVGYSFSGLGREAFRHTDALGMVPLGDLSGGIFASQANAISRDGTYIVGFGNSAGGQEAFRIAGAGGTMTGLGDLPGGGFSSEAKDVSDDGKVVVGGGTTAAGGEAFYWTESTGMARLWDVLVANGLDPAAYGWASLNVANGVTADGATVVGSGTRIDGSQSGFIATVPEPTSAALLAAAGVGLLPRRKRRDAVR